MAQLTIYLDEETQRKAKAAAEREGRSLSSWARDCLSEAARDVDDWPKNFAGLFGSLAGESFDEPEEIASGIDTQRETW